jgi:hypothetical protein
MIKKEAKNKILQQNKTKTDPQNSYNLKKQKEICQI